MPNRTEIKGYTNYYPELPMGYVRILLLGGHRRTGHFALTRIWQADSIYELQYDPALGQGHF